MPEPSRSDIPLRNPQYPQGAKDNDFAAERTDYPRDYQRSSVPPADFNRQLPMSKAESLGRSVGSAVGNVLRFPQHIGEATSRLREVGNNTRANASAIALDMMDTAAQRVEHFSRATGDTLSVLARNARYRTTRLEDEAAQRWNELRSAARERLDVAGRRAATQWNRTQRAVSRVQQEDPVRFLAMAAGTAFVIGAGLRIWRSNHD